MRLKNEEGAWKHFSAREYLKTDQPAFVWDARVDMVSSLFDARVVDNYQQGRAGMRVRLMSALPLVNELDKPELAEGALMRYLGEAVWCPSILLPRRGLQWEAIDEKSARAILTDQGYTVSLTFHFNDRHEVERVETNQRYREVDGRYVPTPWTGYFENMPIVATCTYPCRRRLNGIYPREISRIGAAGFARSSMTRNRRSGSSRS